MFARFKKLKDVWEMSKRVSLKLDRVNNVGSLRETVSVASDYLISWAKYGLALDQYEEFELYKANNREKRNVLSARTFVKFEQKVNQKEYWKYFENKALFNETFKDFVNRNWLYISKSGGVEQLAAFCRKHDRAIVKPVAEMQGKGISVIDLPKTDAEITKLYNELSASPKGVIIEELLEGMPEMRFGRKSLNTLRMYTFDGKLIKCVLRIGGVDQVVDNYHHGGYIFPVDRKYGIIETSGRTKLSTDPVLYLQPDNIKMLGYEIPKFKEAVRLVEEAAKVIPQVRYVGWDVAFTTKGLELIEGNNHAYVNFLMLGHEKNFYDLLKAQV